MKIHKNSIYWFVLNLACNLQTDFFFCCLSFVQVILELNLVLTDQRRRSANFIGTFLPSCWLFLEGKGTFLCNILHISCFLIGRYKSELWYNLFHEMLYYLVLWMTIIMCLFYCCIQVKLWDHSDSLLSFCFCIYWNSTTSSSQFV